MIELKNTTDIEHIADYIEFSMLYHNHEFSISEIRSLLNKEDEIEETRTDSVISELLRRQFLYGDCTPYNVDGSVIKPRVTWSDKPELLMCLIFSICGVEKKKGKDDGTKLFEQISCEAVKLYLTGEAEVLGFPNAKKLKNQIGDISKKTFEILGGRCPVPEDKDKGVDVIAWKPHGDKRCNQVVLLMQCGAGINFMTKKQISITAWKEFLHWSAEPICGIVIPSIPSNDEWIKIRDDYNLIFDRVRLCRALYTNNFANKTLRTKISKWCETVIN